LLPPGRQGWNPLVIISVGHTHTTLHYTHSTHLPCVILPDATDSVVEDEEGRVNRLLAANACFAATATALAGQSKNYILPVSLRVCCPVVHNTHDGHHHHQQPNQLFFSLIQFHAIIAILQPKYAICLFLIPLNVRKKSKRSSSSIGTG
jgi:hypothetical protein